MRWVRHGIVAWGVAAVLLAGGGPAWAGWAIEQVVRGDVEPGPVHTLLQANRMKTVLVGPDGRPLLAHIVDLDTDTVTQVDYMGRRYATATVQEYVEFMRGAMEMAAQAMQQMQEALKTMPPEQRQMVERMMQSQMGPAASLGQACGAARTEVRQTGQRATVAGYPAVRYDVLSDGRPSAEIWVAATLTAWRELDRAKLERFAREMAGAIPGCGPGRGRGGLFGDEATWRLAGEGYPVRSVHRNGGTTTIEVVRAESRVIPPVEFQPPAGFARASLHELLGR